MKYNKKYAFTMIELVFVIVVSGILAATFIPRFDRDNLQEAADQIISHIRYTQHLAMVDDKFDDKNVTWYKNRWQILFSKNLGSNNQWSYTIFSDSKGTHSGNPDKDEIAKNPNNPNKYLTGGTSGAGLIQYSSQESTKKLNIGITYGIENVSFANCGSTAKRIAFDYLGRPMVGNLSSSIYPYQKGRLLTSQCRIALCKDASCDNNITIAIEPETGYAHIL